MKVIVVDDFASVRTGVTTWFQTNLDVSPRDIIEVGDSDQLLEVVSQPEYARAIILLDMLMPGRLKRIQLVREIRQRAPFARIVVYTAYESPLMAQEALNLGVQGYVLKSSTMAVLLYAMKLVTQGYRFEDPAINVARVESHLWWTLTPRESEVVAALCKDWTAEKICKKYKLSLKTFSAHKRNAMKKLGLVEEAGLSNYLRDQGLDYLLDEVPEV